jgi:hypothetical protein
MRRWILIVVLALGGLIGLAALAGLMLPVGHTASNAVGVAVPPGRAFEVITDFTKYPEWRTGVRSVAVEGPAGVGMVIREDGPNGVIPLRVEIFEPPTRLVLRIADPSLPFGGTWTYHLLGSQMGTAVTITENGEIYNPIFRAMQKLFFSPRAAIDTYLADLKKRLGS